MNYTEMFKLLESRGFTMDFEEDRTVPLDPLDEPHSTGWSNVIVSWKNVKFGTMYFHNAMFYTAKDHVWVTQFQYDWTTDPDHFKEFVETFIKSCDEKSKES